MFIMTTQEIAKNLGVSDSTIRMRIKNKKIPKRFFKKIGTINLFDKKYLEYAKRPV